MSRLDGIVSSLRDDGFRITPQRTAIMEYLLKTKAHPSADLIYRTVRKKYPMISLSTVYKTLDLLKARDLLNETDVNGEARFDAHTEDHINLICTKCYRMEDVDEGSLKEIRAMVAKRSRYVVLKACFEMYGYCRNCRPGGTA